MPRQIKIQEKIIFVKKQKKQRTIEQKKKNSRGCKAKGQAIGEKQKNSQWLKFFLAGWTNGFFTINSIRNKKKQKVLIFFEGERGKLKE